VRAIAEQRANDVQLRIADGITRFAGSMWFVYLHFAFAQRDLNENTELTKLIVEALQARQPANSPPVSPADSSTPT
jgi:uncharacterized membrane protein